MRKIKHLWCLVFMLSFLMSMTAFANEITWESAPGHHNQSTLLPSTELSAKDVVQRYARGEIISAGVVEISNPQNGTIRIGIETYAHRNVDMIRHAVFLDQWDDEDNDWVQVDLWDFTKYKEENENNTLSHYSVSFTVSGYPSNRYYRVRGLHAVELDGDIEACSSETNGIIITNGPT